MCIIHQIHQQSTKTSRFSLQDLHPQTSMLPSNPRSHLDKRNHKTTIKYKLTNSLQVLLIPHSTPTAKRDKAYLP